MAAVCPNCSSKLACGCQLATASNGARVCTLCKGRYEQSLAEKKKTQTGTQPVNVNVNYNSPR